MRGWLKRLRFLPGAAAPLGTRAERAAAAHLRRHGYRIIARNVKLAVGEIDIVAEDRKSGSVVIVEVKAGTRESPAPEQHVNFAKQRKLSALARELVKRNRLEDRTVRFDVVGVVWPTDAAEPSRLTHHVNAFEAM